MLAGAGDLTVVGEVADGAQVLAEVTRTAADVVLMDIRMPVLDGIEATRRLRGTEGRMPAVIVLTTFNTDSNILDAIRAGAAGFLVKHAPPEQIVAAVRRAAAGEPVLSPEALKTVLAHVADAGSTDRTEAARQRLARLTAREREVAYAVARGWSNTEIAERLYLSVGSVKAHVSSALTKLELSNRIQLAVLAHDASDP